MPTGRSRAWFPVIAVLGATLVPYLVAEGVHSLLGGYEARTSLAASFLASRLSPGPATQADPRDPASFTLTSLAQIEPLLPLMKENDFGLGNSPFEELETEATSINTLLGEHREQKPNLRKKMGYLRGNLFNPFDQMTFFVDADRKLPPELEAFLDRYAFRTVHHSTNGYGERLTVPASDAPGIVLIAGDSVANGVMLDDSETLASTLQQRDAAHRYVNLGIAGARASDIAAAIARATTRYSGHIEELIYVLCENDFDQGGEGSSPEELVAFLASWTGREKVRRVTLVLMPLIYNAAPEVTRVRGHSRFRWPTFRDERARTMQLATERGFAVIDFLDLAAAERASGKSQFAPLALYVDHAHWSPAGVDRVVSALAELGVAGLSGTRPASSVSGR